MEPERHVVGRVRLPAAEIISRRNAMSENGNPLSINRHADDPRRGFDESIS
jgi:hypothetical protein